MTVFPIGTDCGFVYCGGGVLITPLLDFATADLNFLVGLGKKCDDDKTLDQCTVNFIFITLMISCMSEIQGCVPNVSEL